MGRLLGSLLFVSVLLLSEATADEPSAFRGISFGATEDVIREKFPQSRCSYTDGGPHDDVTCRVDDLTIGDAPVQVIFTLVGEPLKRRLAQVMIGFESKDYGLIKEAFVAKYGEPKVSNEAGLTWQGAGWRVFLLRNRKTQHDHGLAGIATNDFQALIRKRQQERVERARKGL